MQAQIIKSDKKSISPKDMELINNYTMRKLNEDEVYTFKVALCDNDIDRDYEAFSLNALESLKTLFVGKSSIFDHNPKTQNQTARIYECYIEQKDDQKTQLGETYTRLVAKAYLPKSEKNEDFILSLDSGIQKEVSVGCSVSEKICSICSHPTNTTLCTHSKGKMYDGVLCYHILNKIHDAYEWSFVAVPAQRNAGVIKSYIKKLEECNIQDIIKSLNTQSDDIFLDVQSANKLYAHIKELESDAIFGKAFRDELKKEVLSLILLNKKSVDKNAIYSIVEKMDINELKAFKTAFGDDHQKPQLAKTKETKNTNLDGYKL